MSLMERIDEAVLLRFDRLMAWSRDRGSADQWQFAHCCLDVSLAILIASFVVGIWEDEEAGTSPQFGYALLFFVFGFLRSREKRSIDALSTSDAGAMQARVTEAGLRQTNIAIMLCLAVLSLPTHAMSDLLFMLSVMTFDATLYCKAADPPPPARREDAELAHGAG